jgi:mono/diheme cytochrome c family protein
MLAAAGSVAAAAAPLSSLPINEESIAKMRKQFPAASAEVDDPVFKNKRRYQGVWLRDVLKDLSRGGQAEGSVYLRFICKDGYYPIMPLTRALGAKGLLAFRETSATPRGQEWSPLPVGSGGPNATAAPSYLVWIAPPGDPDEYPWPYQMTAIELITSAEALGGLAPDGSPAGSKLYISHCLKCHAINGVGGVFGPELNSPCSVTEYWNPRVLARFISKPTSVRAGSKMPGFESMPEKEIQAIIEYLQFMAGHKKAGSTCPK